jgi:hypothetical protein
MAARVSRHATGVRLLRFGLSTGIAAALMFIGLWTVAQLPIGPSDLIAELFATRKPASLEGLWEGLLWVALIGFFAGAIVETIYEALRWLEKL